MPSYYGYGDFYYGPSVDGEIVSLLVIMDRLIDFLTSIDSRPAIQRVQEGPLY